MAACLSPDFEFQAPIIGPLDKDRFTGALDQFRLLDAFPDMTENWHFFKAIPSSQVGLHQTRR